MADFGLAKEGINNNQTAKSFCGSPAYLAPEMLGTKGVGKAADVYQLGAVLYEFLVGLPPYYTENIKKLYQDIREAKLQFPSYVSVEAKNLMRKLLHKDPKMRPGIKNKDEIKNDPFFKEIDWKKLAKRNLRPPISLTMNAESDNEEEAFFNAK